MFERFTDQSRRAVVLAQEGARRLDHNYIGTEHLLIGLRREGRGAAARALESAGIPPEAAEREVEALVGRGQGPLLSGHIPFTPQAKKCLEVSLREASQLGQGYIGTGHLLLALISQGSGLAVEVLGRLGVDLEDLRVRVTLESAEHPEHENAPPPPPPRTPRVQPRSVESLLSDIENRLSAIENRLSAIENRLQAPLREQHGVAPEEPGAAAG